MAQARLLSPPGLASRVDSIAHIPGDSGLPVFGNTFKALKDPPAFAQHMYAKYGPVHRVNSIFCKTVQLLGPDANELVLQDRNQIFSSHDGWDPYIGELFKNNLMMLDFANHKHHRHIMQAAFKKPSMQEYIKRMNPIIGAGIGPWKTIQNFHFYPAIKKLTLDIAANVFLGMPLGAQADKINRSLIDAMQATTAVVRFPIPGLSYWKGLRGRSYLYDYLKNLIPGKRLADDTDMFTRLCHATSEDGEQYKDDEILDHMIFMMMAAHDTTTSALSTMIYQLAKAPEWQDFLRQDCVSLAKDRPQLLHEDLEQLERMSWAFNETLRLLTPVPTIPRKCIKEFEFNGYRIPANTHIIVSPGFSHKMPEYWSQPAKFDPERFSPERNEHKKHAFQWVPYGGGAHRCIGMHFAEMMAKAFLFQFLPSYRISIVDNYEPEFQFFPIPKPKDGLPVTLTVLKSFNT